MRKMDDNRNSVAEEDHGKKEQAKNHTVDRVLCFFSSPELEPPSPPPQPQASVFPPPPLVPVGGTRLRERWLVPNSDEGTDIVVL
jgi:hypothetical protein